MLFLLAADASPSFDWGMLTAMCAVVTLGGMILGKSIESIVDRQLHEQDNRLSEKFADKEVFAARHQDHENRIGMIENHVFQRRHT